MNKLVVQLVLCLAFCVALDEVKLVALCQDFVEIAVLSYYGRNVVGNDGNMKMYQLYVVVSTI